MSSNEHPLPGMFVSRQVDECRITNFLKKKWGALTQLIGKPETTALYISFADFSDLFRRMAVARGAYGFRMYFASYCLTGDKSVDFIAESGYDKQLTLVFGPTDNDKENNYNDLGDYYIVSPWGGVISVGKKTANQLVNSFRKKKVPLLEAIGKASGIPDYSEGKTMWLSLDSILGEHGWLAEMNHHDAKGTSIFMAAYGKGEKVGNDDVSWNLTVIFVMAGEIPFEGNRHTYHFDIEDTEGFERRCGSSRQVWEEEANGAGRSNGHATGDVKDYAAGGSYIHAAGGPFADLAGGSFADTMRGSYADTVRGSYADVVGDSYVDVVGGLYADTVGGAYVTDGTGQEVATAIMLPQITCGGDTINPCPKGQNCGGLGDGPSNRIKNI